MKNFFRYFLYASLVFLIWSLVKADYLNIPVIFSNRQLVLSLMTLFVGFIISCYSWKKTLDHAGYEVEFSEAISSTGLSVFGKYIPGKIWMILGEAGYISKKRGYPLDKLISVTLNAQFLSLWTGLLTGSIGLLLLDKFNTWGIAIVILWSILTLILFTNFLHKFAETILKKILKLEYQLPRFSIQNILKLLPSYFGYWLCWALSFYFFAASLCPHEIVIAAAFAFPLSMALGIVVIIAPGGVGIREGFLVSYFLLSGLDVKYATTISVASRLWYLSGEFFLFLCGFVLDKIKNKH